MEEFNLNKELKSYNREQLIEEIARLRIVILKGNSKAYQKAKKIFLNEKKLFIRRLKRARVCINCRFMYEHPTLKECSCGRKGNGVVFWDEIMEITGGDL